VSPFQFENTKPAPTNAELIANLQRVATHVQATVEVHVGPICHTLWRLAPCDARVRRLCEQRSRCLSVTRAAATRHSWSTRPVIAPSVSSFASRSLSLSPMWSFSCYADWSIAAHRPRSGMGAGRLDNLRESSDALHRLQSRQIESLRGTRMRLTRRSSQPLAGVQPYFSMTNTCSFQAKLGSASGG
jgi:hypothetical protein